MTDYMAQMLNELMGSQRDAMPGEQKELEFSDPSVCTDFLVGFCVHDLFRNTKNDLGFCQYTIHDESLKRKYEKSDKRGRLGFERRFLERIQRINDDCQRKVLRNMDRLNVTQGENKVSEEVFAKKLEELNVRREAISNKIDGLMNEAQIHGELGKVEAAQAAVDKADRAKQERDELDNEETKIKNERARALSMEESVTMGNRQMQVCQVCGCFMLQNDAQQRIDDHITGKLHIAYQTILDNIERLAKEIDDFRSKRRGSSEREERRRDDRRRSRSRSRDRSHRHGSSSRSHGHHYHHRSDRRSHRH
ncbi:unnamed protein product [Caenorhabditis angaria]|uniref:Uncharacterized protein n=1 Tax=Caenorhabditis angaria TaxID=860376 RepID=A0A9P1IIK7_9PELO|nr:unnamed protein product [Caenorhabditis angaria]